MESYNQKEEKEKWEKEDHVDNFSKSEWSAKQWINDKFIV